MSKAAGEGDKPSAILGAGQRATTVKASEIKVLPALDPGDSYVEPTFVLVETTLDESREPVTTIEHVASRVVGEKVRWLVSTLGHSVPLTHASALEWAVSFAASRKVPIVYHRDDSANASYAASSAQAESPSSAAK
jgi:hypothetical protein